MPLEWMVRGYTHARRRLDSSAASRTTTAMDVSIALFEIGNWLASIAERCKLKENVDVRALTFLRNRKHHHWAAAVYVDTATSVWRWYKPDVLPEPRRSDYAHGRSGQTLYERHLDREGQAIYSTELAEQPVTDVFRRLERVISALAPDADMT